MMLWKPRRGSQNMHTPLPEVTASVSALGGSPGALTQTPGLLIHLSPSSSLPSFSSLPQTSWQQTKDRTKGHFIKKKENINGEICCYLLSNCSVIEREGEAAWRVGTPGQTFRACTPNRVDLAEVGRSKHWSADEHSQAWSALDTQEAPPSPHLHPH